MCYYRPEYAPDTSDEDEEVVEFSLPKQSQQFAKHSSDVAYESNIEIGKDDRRLRRLQERQVDEFDSDEDREAR